MPKTPKKLPEFAFISAPLRSDTVEGYLKHLSDARWLTLVVKNMGYIPITPHLQYLGVLSINDPSDDQSAFRLCRETLQIVNTAFFFIPTSRIKTNTDGSIDAMGSFTSGMAEEWHKINSEATDKAVTFTIIHRKSTNESFALIKIEYRMDNERYISFSENTLHQFNKQRQSVEEDAYPQAIWDDEELITAQMPEFTEKKKGHTLTPIAPNERGRNLWGDPVVPMSAGTGWTGPAGEPGPPGEPAENASARWGYVHGNARWVSPNDIEEPVELVENENPYLTQEEAHNIVEEMNRVNRVTTTTANTTIAQEIADEMFVTAARRAATRMLEEADGANEDINFVGDTGDIVEEAIRERYPIYNELVPRPAGVRTGVPRG